MSLIFYLIPTVGAYVDDLSFFKSARIFNSVRRAGFCRNLNFVSIGRGDIARFYNNSVAGLARGHPWRTAIDKLYRDKIIYTNEI